MCSYLAEQIVICFQYFAIGRGVFGETVQISRLLWAIHACICNKYQNNCMRWPVTVATDRYKAIVYISAPSDAVSVIWTSINDDAQI